MKRKTSNFFRNDVIRFKIVILGEGGVGKTTLTKSYKENTPFYDSIQTIAVDFHTKHLKKGKKTLVLQIWDFGGQRQFRNMGVFHSYCKGCQGALICFDLTDLDTFFELSKWISFLPNETPKVLVGTKLDQYKTDPFLEEDIESFCKNNDISVYRKTTLLNIDSIKDVFKELINLILIKQNCNQNDISNISIVQKKTNRILCNPIEGVSREQ